VCARPPASTAAQASLELVSKPAATDTVVMVRVCLATHDPNIRIGSYHGLVTWDSTAATLIRAVKGKVGMRIENTTKAGAVDFAGAFPAGLNDTIALTLHLALAKPGKLPPLRLHMFELNTVAGDVITSRLRVTGYPASIRTTPGPLKTDTTRNAARTQLAADSSGRNRGSDGSPKTVTSGPPKISSITQTTSAPGDPAQAVIRGSGFAPTGNTVMFGQVELTNLPAADGGTMIRFTVPQEMPATGEAPPMRLTPGEYPVTVRNARGVSNAMMFGVKIQR
jgi:hypothetical protein